MTDISWLSQQAQQVHGVFMAIFYTLVTVLLCLGVFLEYFKWPLGGMPSFAVLVGRALIAVILLHTYPEVSNTIADVTDTLAKQLGDLNQFKVVLANAGDQLKTLTFSWVSVRDAITMIISFASFFILYLSVHIVEAFLMYAWALLYVFSPLLIALFVLPATAPATKAVYRTLFEMGCWKIVWSVLATLLWSSALSDMNKPQHEINFITSICFNLILAGSVLLTPIIVNSLASSGLAGMAQTVGAIGVGAATMSPGKIASTVGKAATAGKGAASSASEHIKDRYFSQEKAGNRAVNRLSKKAATQAPASNKKAPSKATKPSVSTAPSKPKQKPVQTVPDEYDSQRSPDTQISEI